MWMACVTNTGSPPLVIEVIDEWLYAWPRRQMQVWFERSRGVAPGTSRWTLGGKLTGDRQVWRRATRPQALFLATAVALNSTQLLPLFNWFRERLRVVVGYREANSEYTTKYCDERDRSEIVDFLAASDLDPRHVDIDPRPASA